MLISTNHQWLTTNKAAPLIGCSAKKVRKLCDEGKLAYKREGPRRLISIAAIDEYNGRKMVVAPGPVIKKKAYKPKWLV